MLLSSKIAVNSLQKVLGLNKLKTVGKYQWYSISSNYKSSIVYCGLHPSSNNYKFSNQQLIKLLGNLNSSI